MARISTRVQQPSELLEGLIKILESATLGAISGQLGAPIQIGTTDEEVLDGLRLLLSVHEQLGEDLMREVQTQAVMLTTIHARAMALEVMLNDLMSVDYDEALDHSTEDLMDAVCASGAAEITANGELGFDQRVLFSKADIRPMLRAAIQRWIQVKTS